MNNESHPLCSFFCPIIFLSKRTSMLNILILWELLHPPGLFGKSLGRHRHDGPGLVAQFGRAAGRCRSQVAGQPRNGQSAALSAQGEAGDLALPGGRADAPGNLRPQAAIGQTPRPADARVVHQGAADRPASRDEAELLRAAIRLSSGSASRGRRFASCFPISARSPTRCASSAR